MSDSRYVRQRAATGSPPPPAQTPSEGVGDQGVGAGPLGWLDAVEAYRAEPIWKQCIPCYPDGDKSPFPKHKSGYEQRPVTDANIRGWVDHWGEGRMRTAAVGLVMHKDVIGIDVDAYDGKRGALTRAEWEARYGPLPPTASIQARGDGSGIWFFKVSRLVVDVSRWPAGLEPEGHVDLLKWCHRHAVAPPTQHHATRAPRRWYAGEHPQPWPWVPGPADLAWLPLRWVQALEGRAYRPRPVVPLVTPVEQDALLIRMCQTVMGSREGERNSRLFWAACKCAEHGLDPNRVTVTLAAAAADIGMDEHEAAATIDSAFSRPRGDFEVAS